MVLLQKFSTIQDVGESAMTPPLQIVPEKLFATELGHVLQAVKRVRAGFFDGETYFFSREVFKTEVCRGFDPVHAATALKRRKYLETNHGLQFKRRDPDSGRTVPFYAVSSVIFE